MNNKNQINDLGEMPGKKAISNNTSQLTKVNVKNEVKIKPRRIYAVANDNEKGLIPGQLYYVSEICSSHNIILQGETENSFDTSEVELCIFEDGKIIPWNPWLDMEMTDNFFD